MFVSLLYKYKLHTRKNNSYVIINGCIILFKLLYIKFSS